MMENRKLQLYVTERQYRLLKQRAHAQGSIAAVVRDLIDQSAMPADLEADSFFRHVIRDKDGSGQRYDAQAAKRELYERPA
jgi:hypothetical protein